MDQRQLYAIKAKIRTRVSKMAPTMQNWAGIYVWHRRDTDDGNIYFYAGQSVHLIDRTIAHFMQYDHLGLSIRKRGLLAEGAEHGWAFDYYYCERSELDDLERQTIKQWRDQGAIPYNITDGGQHTGKSDIGGRKPARGYMDGLKQGYENARRDISKLFSKNLSYQINGNPTVNKQKAFDKFTAFLAVAPSTEDIDDGTDNG